MGEGLRSSASGPDMVPAAVQYSGKGESVKRTLKSCHSGAYYCAPRHLVAVVADLKIEAGQRHTIVTSSHHRVPWPSKHTRFAVVWIKRKGTEYAVRLSRYSITDDKGKA